MDRYLITGGGNVNWDASNTGIWSAVSGGAIGVSVPGASDAVIMDANSGGGQVTIVYDPTVVSITCGAFTGTLDFGTSSPTMGIFVGSGIGARTITMANMGIMTLTGNNTTIFDISTTTNLTWTPGGTINATYAGATGSRSFKTGASAAFGVNNLKISAGTDPIVLVTTFYCNDLDFTGFAGTWNSNVPSIAGSLTLGSGMTISDASTTVTFTGTGAKTITTNGVSLNRILAFNGVGSTWTLKTDLTTVRGIVVTNGVLTAIDGVNNRVISALTLNIASAGTIILGSATHLLSGTGAVFTVTGTITPGTSTIKLTNTSNTDLTFAGGGKTFNNIWFARGASTATNTITGANTFANFKDDGSEAHTIIFPNATTTVTSWTVSGTVGKLITLARTGASGQFTLAAPTASPVSANYLSISNSVASPLSGWFAGLNSVDGGGNTGWVFNPKEATKFFALI